MIDYTIAAIPTVYNGIRYRSRLEAKWAAFFDLAGWRFEYEPADLGAWSPDFHLFRDDRIALVEVKPITKFDPETALRMHEAARKADFSGLLILLGSAPFAPAAGWMFGDALAKTLPTYWEFEPFGPDLIGEERVSELWTKAVNAVQWHKGKR